MCLLQADQTGFPSLLSLLTFVKLSHTCQAYRAPVIPHIASFVVRRFAVVRTLTSYVLVESR